MNLCSVELLKVINVCIAVLIKQTEKILDLT